jgi:hypothetical protein
MVCRTFAIQLKQRLEAPLDTKYESGRGREAARTPGPVRRSGHRLAAVAAARVNFCYFQPWEIARAC